MHTATIKRNKQNSETGKTGIRETFSSLADDVLLTEDETSQVTGLARNTLKTWRHLGRGPAFVRLGRACRYRVGTIRELVKTTATA